LIGVPAVRLCALLVVTVITELGVAPSPETTEVIFTGSLANAPTISHSGRCLANPRALSGHFWSISLPDARLNALESFA